MKCKRFPTFRHYYLNPEDIEGVIADGVSGTAIPDDGQILIGQSGDDPVPATISAGTGISITNGPGTITIENTSNVPTQNGEITIGSTGNPPINSTITAGQGINITNGPGSITITQNLLSVSQNGSSITTTITSTTFTALDSTQITPGPGNFLVLFDAVIEHSNDNSSTTMGLFLNDSEILGTSRTITMYKKEVTEHVGLVHYLTGLTNTDNLQIKSMTLSGNTTSAHERTIIAIQLQNS